MYAPLPFFVDDAAAKAARLPQYALYRTSHTDPLAIRMNVRSDPQYIYSFSGLGALRTTSFVVGSQWTLEGWFITSQIYSAAMVHVQSPSSGFWVGLGGSGCFTVQSDTFGYGYGDEFSPDTDSWCYFCVTMNSSGYMTVTAVHEERSWSQAYMVPAGANLTSAGSRHTVTLGRRAVGDYQYRHNLSNVRWTNRVLFTSEQYTFPLAVSNAALCVQGSPPVNLVTLDPLVQVGTGTTSDSELTTPLRSYSP